MSRCLDVIPVNSTATTFGYQQKILVGRQFYAVGKVKVGHQLLRVALVWIVDKDSASRKIVVADIYQMVCLSHYPPAALCLNYYARYLVSHKEIATYLYE